MAVTIRIIEIESGCAVGDFGNLLAELAGKQDLNKNGHILFENKMQRNC
jgi:hypothetical protein